MPLYAFGSNFYRAMCMHSTDYAVARCLSVCLSVHLSVRPSVCHMLVLSLNVFFTIV